MSHNSQSKSSPSAIVLRCDVTEADRQRVRALVKSTGVFNPAEVEVALELVHERLTRGPASGYYFVFAERGGQTLGYVCYGPIPVTSGSFDLGRILLEKAEELIRQGGGRRVYIETSSRHDYAATRAFYQRCGYHQEAVLRDFYAPGDDKVIYVKSLI